MRTALYIRVSSDEQVEGYSLDAQLRACRAYADMRGWTVVDTYADEGLSAFKDRIEDRPQLDRLITDIRAGRITAVIVHKLDRFFRRAHLLLQTVEEFERRGVTFVSVNEQIDFSTPIGRVMLANLAAFAEYYSRNLGEETRKGHREKARQGKIVGPVPVGYRKDDQGILVPSDDAEVVVLIFQLYATGQYSYGDIADELNWRGHRLPSVKYTTSFPYSKGSIREILRNPVYRGVVRCTGQEYPGLHQPLIDEASWRAVQQIREPRAGKGGRVSVRPKDERAGLLTEIVACAHCGHPMVYQPGDGNERTRHYYHCSRRINWRDCTARMVWIDAVDAQMLQVVKALALPDDWKPEILAQAEALLKAEQPNQGVSREALIAEIERWGEAYARGAIGKAKFERTIADLQAKMAEAPSTPRQPNLAEVAGLLSQFAQLIDAANLVERRAIVRQLFSKIWVQRHEVVAITPTSLYLPLVAAAQRRYSGGSNNQTDGSGGEPGRGGGTTAGAYRTSVQGAMEARPAHHLRTPPGSRLRAVDRGCSAL